MSNFLVYFLVAFAGLSSCEAIRQDGPGDKKLIKPEMTLSELPHFQRIVVDSAFRNGYQVKSADINADGFPDLVAVSTSLPQIYWYKNPTWERFLISDQTANNIDLAPRDIDADGDMDLALACRFDLNNSLEGGYLYWLQNRNAGQDWELHYIDSFPTSHRIRWADIDGDREEELVNLPIIGFNAKRPDYLTGVEFMYYRLPEDPAAGQWEKHLIDTALHMAHGIQMVRWGTDQAWDGLTASFEGVHLFESTISQGKVTWRKTRLGRGAEGRRPRQGSSEVGLGFLENRQKPFIATIEPWHGDKVVYYTPTSKDELWDRQVIDTTFIDGHALLCADLNRDGTDEIIAGQRGKGHSLYIYQFEPGSGKWERHDLDKGQMSTAGLCILDFNLDGYPDIAACGSATNNVVLYENMGFKK